MFTFAIVGHDEAGTIPTAAAQVLAAAGPRDAAVFVDSASDDGSADVARAAGLDVWSAPLGKGAAMREAIRRNTRPWLVFLDADIVGSGENIAAVLAAAARAHPDAGMLVGQFEDLVAGVLSNTWAVYEPIVAGLFPEIADRCGTRPLSGFRAVRAAAVGDAASMPDDFGVEAWLNVEVGLGGAPLHVVPIGWYEGRFLYKPEMGREIGAGLLDAAERHGRLDPALRPDWDQWVERVVDVVRGYRGGAAEREAFVAALGAVRARPLPPASPSHRKR